jgi:regulator of RNase E activity RraA
VDTIDELRRFPSPTIANAVETVHSRPRMTGVTNSRIVCLFPTLGPVVGYACTATIISDQPPPEPRRVSRRNYWEYVRVSVKPCISVVQDLSPNPGTYWGEVNSYLNKSPGSQGVITNGTVRDLDKVKRRGFHFFASGVQVSHGYAHLEDFDVHADEHHAVVIPKEIVHDRAGAARRVEEVEKPMFAACRLENPIDELDRLISQDY